MKIFLKQNLYLRMAKFVTASCRKQWYYWFWDLKKGKSLKTEDKLNGSILVFFFKENLIKCKLETHYMKLMASFQLPTIIKIDRTFRLF